MMRRTVVMVMAIVQLVLLAPLATAAPGDEIHFTNWGARELSYLDSQPYFLSRQQLLTLPLAPPPPNRAPSTRSDLDELLRLQAARSDAERQSIARHRSFAGLCGAFFERLHRRSTAVPRTTAPLQHLDADMTLAVFQAKRRYNRARPHQLEPRLQPCIPVPPHPAYPSGHALQGHVVARVLAALVPASQDALLALGEQIGREREIAGLHYASDSAASRALGEGLWALLADNAKFREELKAARAEWPGDDSGSRRTR